MGPEFIPLTRERVVPTHPAMGVMNQTGRIAPKTDAPNAGFIEKTGSDDGRGEKRLLPIRLRDP
jgi:hypothetical protein